MSSPAVVRTVTHPSAYRTSILLAALVAVAVWWGLGLPYSMAAWLLDERQLRWTLICYAWEVPVAGLLGPVLIPQIWWRQIERHWDRVFATSAVDPVEAGVVEGMILDYPIRVAWVLFFTSVIGYAVGALQLGIFSQMSPTQLMHVGVLGLVTGLVGGLFAFLYLETLLASLLRDLGRQRPTTPPTGRRVSIRAKVFACSIVLVVCTVPVFATLFWNQSASILEEEAGKRVLAAARAVAPGSAEDMVAGVRRALPELDGAFVVDRTGAILGPGGPDGGALADQGFRPEIVRRMLAETSGYAVDRTHVARIVAFTATADGQRRLVAVVPRHALDHQLREGLVTAAVVFAATLTLALLGGYLFAVRLSRPIEIVAAAADRTAQGMERTPELTTVRTNDEVGELTVALNNMTVRLHDLTGELTRYSEVLEDRVREATRDVTTLYDTTRAVTSTLDEEDVLRMASERLSAALALRDLVLVRYSPHDGTASAYVAGRGHVELQHDIDLSALWQTPLRPLVHDIETLHTWLPSSVGDLVQGPRVLCLPLSFKGLLIGGILASLESNGAALNLEMAEALGAQVAVALANVGLFEVVHRHEGELLELIERQIELREETSRDISRELHDGMGQSLTAIKLELGLLERDVPSLQSPEIAERAQRLQEHVAEVIRDMRTMSQLLRPAMLDDLGLVPSIRSHVEGVGARTGIATELHFPSKQHGRLPPPIELLLYRVTQEAFTNIAKHAQARRAVLSLEIAPERATLTIVDDGVGFDRRRSGSNGVGLLGMRERVASHGGRIEIASEPGQGTKIRLSVPLG